MSKLSDKEKELLKEMKFDVSEGISIGSWRLTAKAENVKNQKGQDKEYIDTWISLQEKINNFTESIEEANPVVEEVTLKSEEEILETPQPEEPKVEKTRLSKKSLEELLSNVEKLGELDKLYTGADEDIPADIDNKIAKLEEKIEKDKHLLGKAMKSSTNAYHIYKERIIEAEKIIKKHKISYNNKKNIRITV